ncbi:MAG TPA: maleylpyruvate isomerase family mycothiol-dependent enzyme [Propionibacteriaceae bacterium]
MSEETFAVTHLTPDQYLTAIRSAAERLHDHAAQAGLTAAVPSCPGWDVAALLAHQGMVHRWAAANVSGDSDHRTEDSEAAAAAAPDLLAWFDDGVHTLTKILIEAHDDLEAMVFLRHAPSPRLFWARRQAHETTIHAVDAQAAALRRLPRPAETMINDELAADGIDELLRGFLPRRKSKLRSETPYVIEIRPIDAEQRWQVAVSEQPPSSVQGTAWLPNAVISGTVVELYLGLWNRYEHLYAEGRQDVVEQWRSEARVSW